MPEAVGVPLQVKTTFCKHVVVKLRVFEIFTGLAGCVELVYAPIVVRCTGTVTCTVAVFAEVSDTPCVNVPEVLVWLQTPAEAPKVPVAVPVPPPPAPFLDKLILDVNLPAVRGFFVPVESSASPANVPVIA